MNNQDWKETKLSDIALILMGQSPKSEFYNEDGKGLPFFQGITEFGDLYPEVKKWCIVEKRIAERGDILMTVRAPVGAVNIVAEKCIIGRGLCAIRSKNTNGRFLFYLIKANEEYIRTYGSGTVYKSITKDSVHNLKFLIPTLDIQRKISNILCLFDDLIDNNQKRIRVLEEFAQLIFHEWFVKYCFPGHEEVPLVDSGTDFGLIPEGWEIVRVGDILERLPSGKEYRQKHLQDVGEIPVYDQSVKEMLGFHNNKPDHIASTKEPMILFGDHTCKMQILMGSFSLGPNTIPIKSKRHSEFFIYYATKDLVKTREYKRHWNEFIVKEIIMPNLNLSQKFAQIIGDFYLSINICQKKNRKLMKTRDLLLPKLISGQIDISDMDIEIDEEEKDV